MNDTSYDAVKVVTPTVRSDHKAVIAYTGAPPRQLNKTRERRVFRRRSPSQHALFLQHAPAATFEFHDGASVQSNFDVMYTIMRELLDRFYPERQVTVTSADPRYITPAAKARRKNRLMRAGRIDEADALALRARKLITRHNTKWLRDTSTSRKTPKTRGLKFGKSLAARAEKTGSLSAASPLRY